VFAWVRRRLVEPDIRTHLLREVDEVIVREVPHHWVVFVTPVLEIALGVVTFAGVFWARSPANLVCLLLTAALWGHGGYRVLRSHKDRFVVTNIRVFRVTGVFAERVATMPLSRMVDITMDKPFHGRLLGYGHFTFESAAQDQGLKNIRHVGDPDGLDKKIQETVQRETSRRGATQTGSGT
jgi:hypothetical protein